MYNKSQNTGPKIITINADKIWNNIDELRAFESFIVRIKAISRKNEITKTNRNRIGLFIIESKNHSEEDNGFHIASAISQLQSIISIATWANCPVSIIS
jgi:hypothetical protein